MAQGVGDEVEQRGHDGQDVHDDDDDDDDSSGKILGQVEHDVTALHDIRAGVGAGVQLLHGKQSGVAHEGHDEAFG